MSEKKPCRYCLNARVDHELSDNNDFSYLSVGSHDFGYRLMIGSGGCWPVRIDFDWWDNLKREHVTRAVYFPKFCPECGRPLMDDYPERRSVYGQEERT